MGKLFTIFIGTLMCAAVAVDNFTVRLSYIDALNLGFPESFPQAVLLNAKGDVVYARGTSVISYEIPDRIKIIDQLPPVAHSETLKIALRKLAEKRKLPILTKALNGDGKGLLVSLVLDKSIVDCPPCHRYISTIDDVKLEIPHVVIRLVPPVE
ncbi:MAG: hypothetical protein D6694_06725 [Gammaproteobacteria bacterium]|nr:MAG: hypothetical protein D6694_06725 [Gammaproteobacteria bacterium]